VKVTSTLLRPAYVSNLRVLAIHGPMASPVLIRQIVQTALWYTATGKRWTLAHVGQFSFFT
jgi:hypothetical protein